MSDNDQERRMTDESKRETLVDRLRHVSCAIYKGGVMSEDICKEAADEIDRLNDEKLKK